MSQDQPAGPVVHSFFADHPVTVSRQGIHPSTSAQVTVPTSG